MTTFTCKSCKKEFNCPELSKEDVENGEEIPEICEECPCDPDIYNKVI